MQLTRLTLLPRLQRGNFDCVKRNFSGDNQQSVERLARKPLGAFDEEAEGRSGNGKDCRIHDFSLVGGGGKEALSKLFTNVYGGTGDRERCGVS